jgi:hypothetical protein
MHYSHYYLPMGIPPNININITTMIMPATITGMRKRKIARTITAIRAIINKTTVDPWNGKMLSIDTCDIININRIIAVIIITEI